MVLKSSKAFRVVSTGAILQRLLEVSSRRAVPLALGSLFHLVQLIGHRCEGGRETCLTAVGVLQGGSDGEQ